MIHLDAKTGYSFMRGFGTPEQWYARCQQIGATAFGLADYNSTWGHIPFRNVFKDVKLLYGVQVAVCVTLDKDPRHGLVTLIAKSDKGLQNLYAAMSLAHEQTYYRARLTWNQLSDLRDSCELIVNECPLGDMLNFQRLEFGYIAVNPVQSFMHRLVDDFKCVATGSPVYPRVQDREGYEILQAISAGQRIGEAVSGGFHMLTRGEYNAALENLGIHVREEWHKEGERISEEANAHIRQASLVPLEGDLLQLALQGASRRGLELSDAYRSRLEHELAVVSEKSFEPYFIFVADLVQWAKERMFVGPARGSSGGSLLCYLLGITEIDPLVHGTLFERFLDPTRSDYPDIDTDFPDVSRDQVFEYLAGKYGRDHVARIGTVSKFGGKSAINDTCKAYGVPFSVMRDISKGYDGLDCGLSQYFKALPDEMLPLLETHPNIAKAAIIEGMPRHTGVHAAGVCVTNEPSAQFGVVDRHGIISLDLKAAEDVGMLKMDALGLRTLSVLADAAEQCGIDRQFLYKLPLDDPKVYEIFQKDMVTGVFQFEGNAVRGLMKRMEVDRFNDLCALTSLARPGPLIGGAAEDYVNRRGGHVDWSYIHEALEPHTKETFGTIVYQEQAMSIVRDLAGFNIKDVNGFRKAVGKKDPVALASYETQFVEGASQIVGDEIAHSLWDNMCEFGSYAFNKSHAVAYSMISYWCAWFKAYHPLEFAVAQLRNAADDEQAKALLRELEREGYSFKPFDPMRSQVEWTIQNGVLLGGFTSVKGIGKKTAASMIKLRAEHGEQWMDELTEAQRAKLTKDFNTPWHDLNRFAKLYSELYNDPLSYRSSALPNGARGPIYRIVDLPDEKGTYTFIARLTRRQPRTKTDNQGKEVGEFCNVYFEDDTGSIGCTIARNKWPRYKWLLEDNYDGQDFIVKGADINGDGRNWLFIEHMIQLGEDDRRPKDD